MATELSDNRLYGIQPEARPLTNSFCREKGIKDIGFYLGRNSRAAIADFNHDIVVLAEGSHPKFALALHGVYGVFDEVGPDLIQLSSRSVNEEWDRFVGALHLDLGLQNVNQSAKRGFQASRDINILYRPLVHIGIFVNRSNQIRYPLCSALYCA